MQLTSVFYPFFFAATALLYFLLPRVQNAILLAASLLFYWFNLPHGETVALWRTALPLAVLLLSILFTFYLGRRIEAAKDTQKKKLVAVGVVVLIVVLAFFKYANFVLPTLLGLTSLAKLGLPLGISFYTFASIGYLVDVGRGKAKAETNLVRWAVFVCFFGTITSGPICRAGKLLPQLAQEHHFEYRRTTDALRLALVGFFKQIAVANVIGLAVNTVFESAADYSGAILFMAALFYALQLYFEFSGYSDLALASGALLGLELPINFQTPYFATNFSGFWNRWHMSLSGWLQDYLFLPLVWGGWQTKLPVIGKKWDTPPVLTSLFITFFISGLWHGNTLPFVVWGILQGVYRIGEELLHKYYKKPKKRPGLALRCFKTVCVFLLWSASLVFFRLGLVADATIGDCFGFFGNIVTNLSLGTLSKDLTALVAGAFYSNTIMVLGYFAFVVLVLALAFFMDWRQCFKMKNAHISTAFVKLAMVPRWLVYWVLITLTLIGLIMQSGGYGGNVSFAYANF